MTSKSIYRFESCPDYKKILGNYILKWKINKSVLVTRVSMTNTTFNKKLANDSFEDDSEGVER